MTLTDVNVWVNAFRPDAERHAEYRRWVEALLAGPSPFAVADIILSGFLRVVTHPAIFRDPNSFDEAAEYASAVRGNPRCVVLVTGPRHWDIFLNLCRGGTAAGNAIPDAYLAALAIEHGCDWVSADRGFRRFAGLRWRHPLDPRFR